jgi:alcohol dehydrogenase
VSTSLDTLGKYVLPAERVLLVTTQGFLERGIRERVQRCLASPYMEVHVARPNPELQELTCALNELRSFRPDMVVGLGGGSALDSAKVLALLLSTSGDRGVADVVDCDLSSAGLVRLPLALIPTTSGTGAEVTPFATVWDFQFNRKHSVGCEQLTPDVALLDPILTYSVPLDTLRWSGLDMLSHALESLWNRSATNTSRGHAFRALGLALQSLPVLLRQSDAAASERLQLASTQAGLAIAHTRTALAHSISYPLTARFQVPHGLACSFTLGSILSRNVDLIASDRHERNLLHGVLEFLRELRLGHEVCRYADPEDILSLSAEMITPQRAGNYLGSHLPTLADLLTESLTDH